jgi:hypothetical protein
LCAALLVVAMTNIPSGPVASAAWQVSSLSLPPLVQPVLPGMLV